MFRDAPDGSELDIVEADDRLLDVVADEAMRERKDALPDRKWLEVMDRSQEAHRGVV